MKHPSVLLFVGTILLLISQHEVQARNYLLWALGLEDTFQGSRQLRKGNFKTRARIAENRQERRQERRDARATPSPTPAPTKAKKVKAKKRNGGAAGQQKKNGRNFLRTKVAAKLAGDRQANVVQVSINDVGGRAAKNAGGGGKAKKNGKATTRTFQENSGGGGGKDKKNDNARARENEAHYEKKKANHNKKQAVTTRGFEDNQHKDDGSLIIDVADADSSAGRIEKADNAAAAKNSVGGGRAAATGGGRNNNRKEEQKVGREATSQITYLKKLVKHREHQKEEAQYALDRTYAKPGRVENRPGRGRGAPAGTTRTIKDSSSEKARKGAGGNAARSVAKGVSARSETHKHKRGFNKRKEEKIEKEHARHQAGAKTDKITLGDGGRRGRGGR